MQRSGQLANGDLHKDMSNCKRGSSSTLLDPESSTLRARLQTPHPIDQGTTTQTDGLDAKAYRRFRDCLGLGSKSANAAREDLVVSDTSLKAAFAEEGLRFYTSVASEIAQAQDELNSKIESLGAATAPLAKTCAALYSNISYPLSATRCYANNVASDTISAHLASMHHKLDAAQQQLRSYQAQWEQCRAEEERVCAELMKMEMADASCASDKEHCGWKDQVQLFGDEVAIIQKRFEEELNDVEADYKELMQAETMRVMQSMMAS
ncbi:hypothetical protein HIM_05350 [Hirsutella minnesotensis 3608]|uniref:Uncharacterized protein n=1 Tax=Hirsutella minnesotensis 3608 TaxID=1043627 RepID=A0A0F7ZKD8_9HYPO|nr:hypothetical protein HIM_05350 [Hirsutella minnesotensis 3608]